MRPRPRLGEVAAAAALAAVAGCGGGGGNVLSDSSKALGDVRSGVLSLRVVIEPSGGAGSNPFGFELKGPFRLGKEPLARMTYKQIANGNEGLATVVLGRDGGYVESNGVRRKLTAQQLGELRGQTRQAAAGGGLRLSEWATSIHERDCGDNVCVDGELDAAKAIAGLTQLQRQLASPPPVEDSAALRRAVRTSRYELVAAKEDKLPRRLTMRVDFRRTVPPKLRGTLGGYVGAKFEFSFALDRANEDVGLR